MDDDSPTNPISASAFTDYRTYWRRDFTERWWRVRDPRNGWASWFKRSMSSRERRSKKSHVWLPTYLLYLMVV